jgi:tetratricopeptide (TPR) repeat protein
MPDQLESPPAGSHNQVTATANNIFQARDIQGGIQLYLPRTTAAPKPRMLPPDMTLFTGREAELDQLDALLATNSQSSAVVISAIAGTAGMGKTSLAVRWAHRAADHFPDGQLYVDLRGYDPDSPVTPEHALDGFLRAMDVLRDNIPRTVEVMTGYYRSVMANRRMLVVLDNAATPEQVRPLLPAAASCLVLITSRSQLAGLAVREGVHRITLDLLSPAEASTLLHEIIGAVRADQEPEALAELARRCGYLPLALRIAAERVAARQYLRIADLVNDLANEQSCLDALAVDGDDITAVRTVFSWSYRALAQPVARIFRLLGLHPGLDISTPAAAAIARVDLRTARRLLDSLVSVHLLTETARDRYHFHALVRLYATETAKTDESEKDRDSAERRLLEWYLYSSVAARNAMYKTIHPHERPLPIDIPDGDHHTFTSHLDAIQWYDREYDTIVAMMDHAANTGHDDLAWRYAVAITAFLTLRGYWSDKVRIEQVGLAAARRVGDEYAQCRLLINLGEVYCRPLGQYREAETVLDQALEIAMRLNDTWTQGLIRIDYGYQALELHRFDAAVAQFEQSYQLLRDSGDRRGEGLSLVHLATGLQGKGQFDTAITKAHDALTIFQETGNQWNTAYALRILGQINLEIGNHGESIEYLLIALAKFRDIEDSHSTAETLTIIGDVYNQTNLIDQARAAWEEAGSIFDSLGSPWADRVNTRLNELDYTVDQCGNPPHHIDLPGVTARNREQT